MTAVSVMAIGGVVWFVGWWEVSDRPTMESQISALNVAVLGMLVIGAGQALWFLRGRRAVHDRRRRLLGADAAPRQATIAVAEEDRFAGSERFYHRLDCAMVDERNWSPSPRAAHERAGRTPCGVCAP
ncbi:hypothetical protein GCM10009547_12750 [Sporichthya brevicatena]|uniref:Uncharacterized protein n=1 Tax=Sporichthya brevicatena TaxID=171442 RepID=A0ABP3RL28_9ACTN